MYQRILLAFDGSPDGREALAQAESLASACGATVHLVAIIDPSESILVVEAMSFIPDNQRSAIQAVLDEAVRRLRGIGCTATSELKYGKPAEQIILSAAETERGFDRRRSSGSRNACALVEWLGRRINPASTAMQRARGRKVRASREQRHADATTDGAGEKIRLVAFPSVAPLRVVGPYEQHRWRDWSSAAPAGRVQSAHFDQKYCIQITIKFVCLMHPPMRRIARLYAQKI